MPASVRAYGDLLRLQAGLVILNGDLQKDEVLGSSLHWQTARQCIYNFKTSGRQSTRRFTISSQAPVRLAAVRPTLPLSARGFSLPA